MPTIARMSDTAEDDDDISALTQNTSATTFLQQVEQDYGNLLRLTPEERLNELCQTIQVTHATFAAGSQAMKGRLSSSAQHAIHRG